MKQGMKRLLVMLLAAIMLLGVSPFGVLAAETESIVESVAEDSGEELTLPEEPAGSETPEETETETPDEPEAETAAETDEAADGELSLDAEEASLGRVRVIVENTTYTDDDAPWTGTLVDEWIELKADSTMMSCVADVLKSKGYTQTGAESGYITEINGLSESDAGYMSGWMGTLNDWFTDSGFGDFTVAKKTLEDGDEIRMMYTVSWGADIGSSWQSADKTVKAISVSAGTLSPEFDKDTHEYTLSLPEGTPGITVTPTASNKNYQVRTGVGTTEYKRTATIPVEDGTVITVKCGDPAWPSMNGNAGEAQVYTLTVEIGEKPVTAAVTIRAQAAGAYLCGFDEVQTVPSDLAESYGYKDSVDGVSALDALVRAHELIFGEDFTKATAKDYLVISSSGYVTTLFCEETGNNGFFVNEGFPNDGTNSPYGGYNGTTVVTQEVVDNDVIDFFIYQDSYCLDYYTWVSAPSTIAAGKSFSAVVSGVSAMMGYEYKTPADMKAAAEPIEDAGLAWVDAATGAVTEIDDAAADEDGVVTVTAPDKAGRYWLAALGNEDEELYVLMNPCVVNVVAPPESITIEYTGSQMLDGKLIGKQGDSFSFRALDADGNVTPVTWKNGSAWNGTLDADGVFTVTSELSTGGTSYLYITATSTLDSEVSSKEYRFELTGYQFSSYYRNTSIALSADGQTAKTVSLSGGVNGHNTWSYDIPEGVAALAEEPGKTSSAKFSCLRPGVFTVSVAVDGFEDMCDTATVTVTGVAVEDADGGRGKSYVELSSENTAPTLQLAAYLQAERSVASWASADETIASVDEDGLVTAHKVGTTLITVTDSEGSTGGIKVVVTDADTPYFEALELMSNAVTGWTAGVTFQPTELKYNVAIKSYSTSTLTLQATTLYNSEKYTATAHYTDADGKTASVAVNSGKVTSLPNIAFGTSDVTITLADRSDAAKKTDYVLHVTRPRDTSKAIKASSGIVLVPDGRKLLAAKYNGQAEGTMFQLDADGEPTTTTGVKSNVYGYQCSLLNGTERFALTLASSTAYVHLRWSADGGESWTELPQGGGTTGKCGFDKDGKAELLVQIIDDKSYAENKAAGRDGFALAEGETAVEYRVKVVSVAASVEDAQLLTAECDAGDWYPAFYPAGSSFTILVPNGTTAAELRYTTKEGAAVTLGKTEQTPDEDGVYTLALKTSAQTLTVTSEDGIANSYSFKLTARSKYAVPDRVVDYLCIGSQYTNAGYGINPEATLAASLKSLGNFGGYITYYYESAITDDPRNRYGIDFYVYGNSFADGGSAGEAGQVYVSADGERWYALAGSEHYEHKAIWDYTISYTKGEDGKSTWTDNQGNSMTSAAAVAWPSSKCYYFNDVSGQDSYSFTGILLKSEEDGTVMGSSTTSSFAAAVRFGYADYYKNGTFGADVNPYVENPTCSNGFDLAWAVDAAGSPVKLDAIHYIRVATASNIWAGVYKEKSTEVTAVVRTTPQEEDVGGTALPASVTLSDADGNSKTVALSEGNQIYTVSAGGMQSVSVTVNGMAEDVNIYVNNQRVAPGEASNALTVPESGTKLIRVIVQSGDAAPSVALLRLAAGMDEDEVAAIENVQTLISSVGEVTLDSGEKIEAARAAYDALTPAQQALVSNYDVLTAAETAYATKKAYTETLAYLEAQGTSGVGSVGGEWAVITLARAGKTVGEGYATAALQYILDQSEDDRLNGNYATENARLILALTAIGRDASKLADVDLTAGLDEMAYITKQGVNGSVWALLALDSHDWPVSGDVTREKLVQAILDAACAGGGWTFYGNTADPDMTGMALTALAPYYKRGDAAVVAAVDKALGVLADMQDVSGGFASWGSLCSESCAQVVTALTALGIDPAKDTRFIKNGKNPLDALCSFAVEGGGFAHSAGGERNAMATEQGAYALAAYFRFKNGETSLYDMSDVTLAAADPVSDAQTLIDAIGTVDANSGRAVRAASRAYKALTVAQRGEVSGSKKLEEAEKSYEAIEKEIADTIALIDKIDEVTLANKRVVTAAQAAYEALSRTSQAQVTNSAKLAAAVEKLAKLERVAAVIALIDAIGTVDKDSGDKIKEARAAYDALSAEEKTQVTNYAALTAAERRLAALDPQGGTKTIGSGGTKLVLDGVTYMVDAEAASLMKRIAALRDDGGTDDDGILEAYKTYDAMSSKLKAQVFNYDDLEALCTALGVRGHHDSKTGMKAEGLPWYVLLEVEALGSGSEYETVAGSIGSNRLAGLWRVSFIDRLTGEAFTPYEDVSLCIEAPSHDGFDQLRIARLGDDGRVTYSECSVTGGELVFAVSEAGVYGFIGGAAEANETLPTNEPEEAESEETAAPALGAEPVVTALEPEAQHSLPWLWIVIGAAAAVVLVVAIVLKRRNKQYSK